MTDSDDLRKKVLEVFHAVSDQDSDAFAAQPHLFQLAGHFCEYLDDSTCTLSESRTFGSATDVATSHVPAVADRHAPVTMPSEVTLAIAGLRDNHVTCCDTPGAACTDAPTLNE